MKRFSRAKHMNADDSSKQSTSNSTKSPATTSDAIAVSTLPIGQCADQRNVDDTEVDDAKQALDHLEPQRRRTISQSQTTLGKIAGDERLNAVQSDLSAAHESVSAQALKNVYESEGMRAVRDGVNKLADSLPGLVKALNEVANIHPFIGVAVGAFRVVIELNVKRQDNDKKISLLILKMKDMMESLLLLRTIEGKQSEPSDGLTVKARLEKVVQAAAKEIKKCANTCDTYAKKSTVVKVLMAPVWDGQLQAFVKVFESRRDDIMTALALHTDQEVAVLKSMLGQVDSKLDDLLKFLKKALSPKQQELMDYINRKFKDGTNQVLANDDALEEVINFKSKTDNNGMKRLRDGASDADANQWPGAADRDASQSNKDADGNSTLALVKQELFDSPEVAIRENLEVFERKFAMQQKELQKDLERIVSHAGDRVIAAVNSGAHDRIIDTEIHEIWKEMRWPGHVKARHFILALREYYRQQIVQKRNARKDVLGLSHAPSRQPVTPPRDQVDDLPERKANECSEVTTRVSDQDEWALQYININRLQALVEAFDDDASGFVTIAEVNHFTSSRPKDWSLPHWLAYWAIGWHMTSAHYRDQILVICSKMFAIRSQIRSENRILIDRYLKAIWKRIYTLAGSLGYRKTRGTLEERFSSYVEKEELRLRDGLEAAKYRIDAQDTLSLITGPGRIEQHVMPLLYLLLQRDFEIFRLGRKHVLNDEELLDSARSIVWVFSAVRERHDELAALFVQQRLEPSQQFKNFAGQLFNYWHNDSTLWSLKNMRNWRFDKWDYEDAAEERTPHADEILKYPSPTHILYPTVQNDLPSDPAESSDDHNVRRILGRWNGFMGASLWPMGPMMTFCFQPSSVPGSQYECHSETARGNSKYTILGSCTVVEGIPTYELTIAYTTGVINGRVVYLSGTISEDGYTLSGRCGYNQRDLRMKFHFSRLPPETLIARPTPGEFEENRVKALWRFSLTAALNEVRRSCISWSYIRDRRDVRREYLELIKRKTESNGNMTEEEVANFARLNGALTYDDVRCYFILETYRRRKVARHSDVSCDVCHVTIYGPRVVCLECVSRTTFDFCDKAECYDQAMETRNDISSPHLPTHDMVRIRASIHFFREIGNVLSVGKTRLERARQYMLAYAEVQSKNADAKAAEQTPVKEPSEDWLQDSDIQSVAEMPTPKCMECSETVSQPSWYCIDCPDDAHVFICYKCDEKGGFDKGEYHKADHNLVRCTEKRKDAGTVKSTEERLTTLESQLTTLTVQMDRMEKVLQAILMK